jgi:putative spermidine/putrescine transport system permease protein
MNPTKNSRRSDSALVARSPGERISRACLRVLVALVTVFVVFPIVIVVIESFNKPNFLAFPPDGWSLQWYKGFFEGSIAAGTGWVAATLESAKIAVVSMILATTVGTMISWWLARTRSRAKSAVYTLFFSPLVVPGIVAAIAYFFFLSYLHLIGNYLAIAAIDSVLGLPLVVMILVNALDHFDRSQEEAARTLGANALVAVWRVTIPQIGTAIIVSAIAAFAWSFDETIIIQFVSGTSAVTLPRILFSEAQEYISPVLAVAGVVLIAASVILAGLARVILVSQSRRRLTRARVAALQDIEEVRS